MGVCPWTITGWENNTVLSVGAQCSSTALVWLLYRKIHFPSSHNASFQYPNRIISETCKWMIPFG